MVVRDGKIIATGTNLVTSTNDPTAHAEVVAIRAACKALGDFQLDRMRGLHQLRAVPDVPGRALLGALRGDLLWQLRCRCQRMRASTTPFCMRRSAARSDQRRIPMTRLLAGEAKESFDAWRTLAG